MTDTNIIPMGGGKPSGEHLHQWHGRVSSETTTTATGTITENYPAKPMRYFIDHVGSDGAALTLWSGDSATEAQAKALQCGAEWGLPVRAY